jgi:hypothetical protein
MPGFPLRPLAQIGETHIAAQTAPDISPGHQRLLITNDRIGRALAALLDQTFVASGDDWLVVAHTAEVDMRLLELVNLCASARFTAPSLVQLALEGLPR